MIEVGPAGEKYVIFRLGETLDEIEKQIIQLTLENNSGNRSMTAKALGVSLGTIKNKIAQYGFQEVGRGG